MKGKKKIWKQSNYKWRNLKEQRVINLDFSQTRNFKTKAKNPFKIKLVSQWIKGGRRTEEKCENLLTRKIDEEYCFPKTSCG